jgi:hypothetical protein
MSTKATLAYDETFHFYHEVMDDDHVYLELKTTHFQAGYGRVMLPIPMHIWETIRHLGGARLDLVDDSDDALLARVMTEVDERLAQYQETLREHPDRAGLIRLAGSFVYGSAEAPRDAQIASGLQYYREERQRQHDLQAAIRRLQATQRGKASAHPEPAPAPAVTPGPLRTLELVALLGDIPEYALRRGDVGIVVQWHIAAAQYEVEFSATPERARVLVTVPGAQLLKLHQAYDELTPYAALAEHVQERWAPAPALNSAAEATVPAPALLHVPEHITLHDLLHLVCPRRPTDFTPYGIRQRDAADCSCGCKHFVPLDGNLGADWGVCTHPRSPRAGLLTFEHQGCEFFAYDERLDAERESDCEP